MIAAFLSALAVQASAPAPLVRHHVERADGSDIDYWLEASDDRRSDVVLVMQGTGCEPVMSKPNLRHAGELLRPAARTLLIDKAGVSPANGKEVVDGCPKEHWDRYTLSGRVQDCLQVIADLRRQPWWSRRIVLFGGSEGGAVAALLAPLVPEAIAVVILSSGTGVPVGELVRAAVPPVMTAEAPSVFAAARERPTGGERWAGLSFKWWADAVDLVPARQLALSQAPILLLHGARDTSSPVSTARAGHDRLRAAKANVTYREFADLDHFMRDANGVSHMDEVLEEVGRWINRDAARKHSDVRL